MAGKKYVLTETGRDKLINELEELKTVTRKENAERIKVALSFGDLSENSEYDEAKNQQPNAVTIGSKVRLLDTEYDEEVEYHIVGSTEAEPMMGKISDESPVGKALLGHMVGDNVEVEAPDGILVLKILEISR